jgi:hypothetical protein
MAQEIPPITKYVPRATTIAIKSQSGTLLGCGICALSSLLWEASGRIFVFGPPPSYGRDLIMAQPHPAGWRQPLRQRELHTGPRHSFDGYLVTYFLDTSSCICRHFLSQSTYQRVGGSPNKLCVGRVARRQPARSFAELSRCGKCMYWGNWAGTPRVPAQFLPRTGRIPKGAAPASQP